MSKLNKGFEYHYKNTFLTGTPLRKRIDYILVFGKDNPSVPKSNSTLVETVMTALASNQPNPYKPTCSLIYRVYMALDSAFQERDRKHER